MMVSFGPSFGEPTELHLWEKSAVSRHRARQGGRGRGCENPASTQDRGTHLGWAPSTSGHLDFHMPFPVRKGLVLGLGSRKAPPLCSWGASPLYLLLCHQLHSQNHVSAKGGQGTLLANEVCLSPFGGAFKDIISVLMKKGGRNSRGASDLCPSTLPGMWRGSLHLGSCSAVARGNLDSVGFACSSCIYSRPWGEGWSELEHPTDPYPILKMQDSSHLPQASSLLDTELVILFELGLKQILLATQRFFFFFNL